MNYIPSERPLTAKDFASDQEVRWCPGCGDYAILKAVQKTLADISARPENTVFVSGIGCSSRFPYYMATYGFHTIHGRAPAVATGIKLARPELDVWIATGDGDALSIGGNHLMHLLRRNVDLQILLFNNEIYGLTKGQYSPTSHSGTLSPSSPKGSLERPISPALFALGAGARFVARAIDTAQKQLVDVLKHAHAHAGTSFVEIFQNCIVYNDEVFSPFTAKESAAAAQIHVEHGKPLVFAGGTRGLVFDLASLSLSVVNLDGPDADISSVLVHDQRNRTLAHLLAAMEPPALPMALGVLYCDPAPTLDAAMNEPAARAARHVDAAALNGLLRGGDTWTIAG
jgi:2-oxoglutarate ferredoxin oxidoreductase subunit beta